VYTRDSLEHLGIHLLLYRIEIRTMKYELDVGRKLGDCEQEHCIYRVIVRVEQGWVRWEIEWYLRFWKVNWLVWGRARLMSDC